MDRHDRNSGGAGLAGVDSLVDDARVESLPARHISLATCEKFNYQKATYKGKPVQVANYYRNGTWVCAKLRFKDKGFTIIGDGANAPLYGQHLWRDGGKRLVITEGELDAMSMSQVQGNRWPVVSIPNGTQSAVASIKRELEWVEKFDTVIFMFDMDEPGQAAAKAAAELLTPGKAHIAVLPLKDANEMLKAGRVKELSDAQWGAKVFRPDGIVMGVDMFDEVSKDPIARGVPYPYPMLDQKLRGLHLGKIVTITAGEGIGKSTMARELTHHLGVVHEQNVGGLFLEENLKETGQHLMGIHMNRRLTIDDRTNEELDDAERAARRLAFEETLGTGRFFFYEHFGSTDVDNLLSRVRYLARGCDCRWIVLDHLSIVVSSMEDERLDERKLIDKAMTMLRTLVEELGITLILVVHLSRTGEGKGYDEGARPRLSKLRGSAAIGQLSDIVISLERDMQSEDASRMQVRILKSRQVGITGLADTLVYNHETGRYDLAEPEAVGDF
jgi:twinkle protein